MNHGRNFDTQVHPHDAFLLGKGRFRLGQSDIGDPLPPFFLDPQEASQSHERNLSTSHLNLLGLAIHTDGQDEMALLDPPVLIIPLANGLLEERQNL